MTLSVGEGTNLYVHIRIYNPFIYPLSVHALVIFDFSGGVFIFLGERVMYAIFEKEKLRFNIRKPSLNVISKIMTIK